MIRHLFHLLAGLVVSATAVASDYPRTGAQATLATYAHNVSGTATIVSSNSIRVDNFHYDGGGPAVYFYLGTNDTDLAYTQGTYIGPLLTGTSYTGQSVTVSLPPGQSLDGYNALSVWCVDFSVNFGSGTFQPFLGQPNYANGLVTVPVTGASGEVYQLQGTTNLVSWTGRQTRTNTTGTVQLTDTNAAPLGLYRVIVQ